MQLLVHETLGGMCPFAARRLRRLARDAATSGCDATDYTISSTARSFVPFYAQRISSAIVMNGAQSILDGIARAPRSRSCPQRPAPPLNGVGSCGCGRAWRPCYLQPC